LNKRAALPRFQTPRYLASGPSGGANNSALSSPTKNSWTAKAKSAASPFFAKPMRQWMLRITRLRRTRLTDLDTIQGDIPLTEMQRNWIGRSEGAEVDFEISTFES